MLATFETLMSEALPPQGGQAPVWGDKAQKLFEALNSCAALTPHIESVKTDANKPLLSMPECLTARAVDLTSPGNFHLLCAAIKTFPSGIHTHKVIAKSLQLLDSHHAFLLSKAQGKARVHWSWGEAASLKSLWSKARDLFRAGPSSYDEKRDWLKNLMQKNESAPRRKPVPIFPTSLQTPGSNQPTNTRIRKKEKRASKSLPSFPTRIDPESDNEGEESAADIQDEEEMTDDKDEDDAPIENICPPPEMKKRKLTQEN